MYVFTPAGKFKDSGFSCFNYFLFSNTCLEYFRRLSFKITFWGEPLEGIPGQSLTKSVLTVASIVSKTSSTINSLSFTFLEMCRSDSSLQNLVFSSFRWFFSSSKMLLNFPWYYTIKVNILTKSSLFNPFMTEAITI